jgi:plastocyanin
LNLEEKKVEAIISVAAAPRKIAIQSGKIPEMESEHQIASMESEHKMANMKSENKIANMESDNKMAGKRVTITMQGPPPRFQPQTLEIESGTTVEWVNTGTKVHTVTGENSHWDSGSLEPGEKFSKEFDQKGTFKYYCVPHRDIGMVGTIIVK